MSNSFMREVLLERCRKGDNTAMLEMSKYGDEEIANMWLVRAVLYGNKEAREILRKNPKRASKTMLPIEYFIPELKESCSTGYFTASDLKEAGFDNLKDVDWLYTVAGLSIDRVLILGMKAGYEPPDKDGFGAEVYFNYYIYDEFFHRIHQYAIEDNIELAYLKGAQYLKTCPLPPYLHIDWLVEDGILDSDKLARLNWLNKD